MPQQTLQSTENNFSAGFKTEYTSLNFPENAVIDSSNCVYNRIGNVTRRLGIDYEANFSYVAPLVGPVAQRAVNTYKWNNVANDGETQMVVVQTGAVLEFFVSSSTTTLNPLSRQLLGSHIDLTPYTVSGSSFDITVECTFADGNGYLFVYHPNMTPIYVTYSGGVVSANPITIYIRDFQGVTDNLSDTFRPPSLSNEHKYNLYNQGWNSKPTWTATSTTVNSSGTGVFTWTVQAGLAIAPGDVVSIIGTDGRVTVTGTGVVTFYGGTTLTINISSISLSGISLNSWTFSAPNNGTVDTWHTAEGNYPSNSDSWWLFKNTSGVFDPLNTVPNVTLNAGPAPKGFFILSAFYQDRSNASGVSGLSVISTSIRPKTGTWFQGRVWYAGVDSAGFGENIYFSQIIERTEQFGKCYQTNDPTSEDRFDLLPTDGGLIRIQGCGSIYKLFPIQNGLLVFAANGVWFITGSQGIGFTANDYTIAKISSIQAISTGSFVDVQGLPIWWNEEGIYQVTLDQQNSPYGPSRGAMPSGGLTVQPITFTTIQTFYQNIPLSSKRYVKGAYDPLNWEIRWVYRSTEDTTGDRYLFDSVLQYNTVTQAFSPWSLAGTAVVAIAGLVYVQSPGGSMSPDPTIKYIAATNNFYTFAEERDTTYVDFYSTGTPQNFDSHFITGYKLHGKGQFRGQINYLYMFLNTQVPMSYQLQGLWDFASSSDAHRWSTTERVDYLAGDYAFRVKRHRVRGRGLAYQLKVSSVTGKPFDIQGWSIDEKINAAV